MFTLGPVAGATNTVNAVVSGVGVVTFTATAGGEVVADRGRVM